MKLNILFGIKSILENTGKPSLANAAKHAQRWLGQKTSELMKKSLSRK